MDKTKYVWQEFSIEIHYLWKEGLHKEKYDFIMFGVSVCK